MMSYIQPRVSIVIPTYNYGHFIAQTLESVKAQTYKHWECIVVDDGSTDNTRAVVTGYAAADERIRYVYQENQGQPAALNTGCSSATGNYLQILDADDLLEGRKLERQVEYLEQHPDVDILYGAVRYFRTESPGERLYSMAKENSPWMPEISGAGKEVLLRLIERNIMPVNAPLIKKDIIQAIGFFDDTLWPLQDWDYWVRCALQGRRFAFQYLEDTLALVRMHAISASQNSRQMLKAEMLLRTKLSTLTDDPELLSINHTYLVQLGGLIGAFEISAGRWRKGFGQLLAASMRSSKAQLRFKWLVCALASPLLSGTWLLRLATSPASESPRYAWRKLKSLLDEQGQADFKKP